MTSETEPVFDAEHEAEWQRQERAWADERTRRVPALSEASAHAAYRAIVRALREPAGQELPAGFSAAVAQLALPRRRSAWAGDAWFERGLPWLTALLFGGAGGLCVWLFRDDTRTLVEGLFVNGEVIGWGALFVLGVLIARAPLPAALRSRLL
jgi:hypothetical protein